MTPKPLKATPAPLARRQYGCCAIEAEKKEHHGGSYAKGWAASVETDETGTSCTVHNKQYQLTHLLEKGHAIANQSGRYPGHVAGDHVIEGVYNEVAAEFAKGGE